MANSDRSISVPPPYRDRVHEYGTGSFAMNRCIGSLYDMKNIASVGNEMKRIRCEKDLKEDSDEKNNNSLFNHKDLSIKVP